MKTFLISSVIVATGLAVASSAGAATLQLDGFTSDIQNVTVASSPAPNTPSAVGSSGFNMTDVGTGESFVAWCLDISHYLMSTGSSQDYAVTADPYSNSLALTDDAIDRVQSVFDANYASLDFTDGDQAAAFQMALWEAAYEADGTTMSVDDGLFAASSTGSTALANTYLANAEAYMGPEEWNISFLELEGLDANRPQPSGQNLVTVSAVPLPAAGLLLLTGLFGSAAITRRRRKSAEV